MTRGNQRDTDRAKAQKKAAAAVSHTHIDLYCDTHDPNC